MFIRILLYDDNDYNADRVVSDGDVMICNDSYDCNDDDRRTSDDGCDGYYEYNDDEDNASDPMMVMTIAKIVISTMLM